MQQAGKTLEGYASGALNAEKVGNVPMRSGGGKTKYVLLGGAPWKSLGTASLTTKLSTQRMRHVSLSPFSYREFRKSPAAVVGRYRLRLVVYANAAC